MKVLAINSSPRAGGNSDILCNEFLRGAKESGHETVQINLGQKKLSPCRGCDACAKTGKCFQKDDMEEILSKTAEADVILLATPVYFYSVSAQLKMFIDRCYPAYQQLRGKKFYLAVTAADTDHEAMEPAVASMRGYLRCLPGAEELGVFYATGAWNKGDIRNLPVLKEVYQAGKRLNVE